GGRARRLPAGRRAAARRRRLGAGARTAADRSTAARAGGRMSIAALVLLAVAAGGGLLLTAIGERVRPSWGGGLLTLVLAGAAVLAWRAHGTAPAAVQAGYVVGTLAAIAGGGPVASAVLRA